MTVLSACQSALIRLIKRAPPSVFSSTDPTVIEVADLVNEVAAFIMKENAWQALTQIHTITGDGASSSFPLPVDYDRMMLAGGIEDPQAWFWGYAHVASPQDWMRVLNGSGVISAPGAWTLMGGSIQFSPTLPSGQQEAFPYVSKNYALSATGVPKDAFTRDDDTFRLDDRLLTLGLVFRWRQQKGMEYSADEENFNAALSQASARDRAPGIIRQPSRLYGDVRVAYPWALGS